MDLKVSTSTTRGLQFQDNNQNIKDVKVIVFNAKDVKVIVFNAKDVKVIVSMSKMTKFFIA